MGKVFLLITLLLAVMFLGGCLSGEAPQCGNGACESGETYFNCRVDCLPEACGDGVCQSEENEEICPEDCLEQSCECSDWQTGSCGEAGCAGGEIHYWRECVPSGCDLDEECEMDSSCIE